MRFSTVYRWESRELWNMFLPFPSRCQVSVEVKRKQVKLTFKLKTMNPVIRQILDNIRRLCRELKNSQPNPPQTNGGTMTNERTLSVEGEALGIFRRSRAQPSPSICTSNASFTSTVSNVITSSTSIAAQQGASSTNSMLTPCFRLVKTLARKAKQKVIEH